MRGRLRAFCEERLDVCGHGGREFRGFELLDFREGARGERELGEVEGGVDVEVGLGVGEGGDGGAGKSARPGRARMGVSFRGFDLLGPGSRSSRSGRDEKGARV